MATECEWTRLGDSPCCCIEDCCLYPWPDPTGIAGGPYYPSTDLPDTVVVQTTGGPVVLTRGAGYIYTGSGWEIIADDSRWQITDPDFEIGFSPTSCLIGEYLFPSLGTTVLVEDQFQNSYNVNFDYSGFGNISGTVERVALCQWQGTFPDAGIVKIIYDSFSYEWYWDAVGNVGAKDPPQSSPEGNYDDIGSISNFTVTP